MSILIVDDTASQRLLLASFLRSSGYTDVLMASSAADAFRQLGIGQIAPPNGPIDLILMDIDMPGMDGISACRQLRATVALSDIPVIMVTASTEAEDLQLAFDAGANDYITKPPSKIELLARVRAALRLKRETDQRKAREQQLLELTVLLHQEQEEAERLLLNILPAPIAARLKQGERVIADYFAEATVLFADLVDFTPLAAHIPPVEIVSLLNEIFSAFDQLANRHGLEKIKTIGDAYMVVGGVPVARPDHAEAVAEMALAMQSTLAELTDPRSTTLQLRIGIHTGPVIAGVIGTSKFAYDLWGDTVNIASRMESQGRAGAIQVTDATRHRLCEHYRFEQRGTISVKGRGEMVTYLLVGLHDPIN